MTHVESPHLFHTTPFSTQALPKNYNFHKKYLLINLADLDGNPGYTKSAETRFSSVYLLKLFVLNLSGV